MLIQNSIEIAITFMFVKEPSCSWNLGSLTHHIKQFLSYQLLSVFATQSVCADQFPFKLIRQGLFLKHLVSKLRN